MGKDKVGEKIITEFENAMRILKTDVSKNDRMTDCIVTGFNFRTIKLGGWILEVNDRTLTLCHYK